MQHGRSPRFRERSDDAGASSGTLPEQIAERYRVRAMLGRGGMAVVYRVHDERSGRELALKQLLAQGDPRDARDLCALFERECACCRSSRTSSPG